MRKAALAAVVAVIGLAAGLLLLGGDDDARDEPGKDGEGFEIPTDGDPVPDLAFARFDGSEASLGDYEGTPLVVNFFASWCVPCAREMPEIEELHQELGDDVAFLGLAVNDRPDDAQGLIDATGVTYDLGLDPKSEIVSTLGGVAMPTTVLVSADGRLVGLHTGELTRDELSALIAEKLEVS